MSFDWDAFSKLSDEEKIEFMKKAEKAAREASKGKTIPPGAIGLEKRRWMEGSEVVGRMKPDGTVHYYTEEEKQALLNADSTDDNEPDTDGGDEPA